MSGSVHVAADGNDAIRQGRITLRDDDPLEHGQQVQSLKRKSHALEEHERGASTAIGDNAAADRGAKRAKTEHSEQAQAVVSPPPVMCTVLMVKGESPDLDQAFVLPSGDTETEFAIEYLTKDTGRGRTTVECDRWSKLVDKWNADASVPILRSSPSAAAAGAGAGAGATGASTAVVASVTNSKCNTSTVWYVPAGVAIDRIVCNGDDF